MHPPPSRRAGDCQHAWLRNVQDEVAASGAPAEGICWSPWLDQPVWGRPGMRRGWRGQLPLQEAA